MDALDGLDRFFGNLLCNSSYRGFPEYASNPSNPSNQSLSSFVAEPQPDPAAVSPLLARFKTTLAKLRPKLLLGEVCLLRFGQPIP